MMKLSKMPFMALMSLFLLTNIIITSLIIATAPSSNADKPFKDIVQSYWLEQDSEKQSSMLVSLYPEIDKDFPNLVQAHKFYVKNNKKNGIQRKQIFSELTLKIFSFYQYVKRKNWQTLTRLSYQGLQQYATSLDQYITDGKFNARKIMRYNNEMKSLTRSSQLRPNDQKLVLAKIDILNRDLNRAEINTGEKMALDKITRELNSDLATLSNFSKPTVGLNYIDKITELPFKTIQLLVGQYLISGIFLFMLIGLYRSKRDFKFNAIYENGDQPFALLNKKGQFLEVNKALKEVLPFKRFNMIRNLNWDSFEKLAGIDLKKPLAEIKETYITSGHFTKNGAIDKFLVRMSPNKRLNAFELNLISVKEIETFQELEDLPVFNPPEANEEIHLSYILEDVVAELSNLFQSKQVELLLQLKGEKHIVTGNVEKTHQALKTFVRDMVLALSPKSKSKNFTLTLEDTLDGTTLRADMDDVKLATPILKSNFKFEEDGMTRKRNLNQGIEILKNSGLGFDLDLDFGNNFDINNKFIGSNISISMHN